MPVSLPPGVVGGATPYDAMGRVWDASLVRWQDGRLRPVGGWQKVVGTPFSKPVRQVLTWRTNNDSYRVAVGTENDILVYGDSFVSVKPTDLAPFSSPFAIGYGVGTYGISAYGTARSSISTLIVSRADQWSFSLFGEDLFAVATSDGRLLRFVGANSTPARMTVQAGAPISNHGVFVTDERHVVLLGAGGVPRRVAWSNREDPSNWDYASVGGTAGYLDLQMSSPIVGAVKVREGFLVFGDRDVYLMRYIGAPFVYALERLGETGLINARTMASYEGRAYWMSSNAFWKYEGGTLQKMDCPVGGKVFPNMGLLYTAAFGHACAIQRFPEIWFWYCSTGSMVPDRYVIYCPLDDWWSIGALTRTASAPSHADSYWYAADDSNYLYQQENGWTNSGSPILASRFAETGVVELSNGKGNLSAVRAFVPTAIGGGVTMRAFSRQSPDGPETAWGPYSQRSDGWMDTRFKGRDLRLRFQGAVDGDWSLGQVRLDVRMKEGR